MKTLWSEGVKWVLRLMAAAVFAGVGLLYLRQVVKAHGVTVWGPELFWLLGILALLGGLALIMPLAGWLSKPLGNIYYSGAHADRPPPMYSIPESKAKKGLYEEALAGYAQIAAAYPDEIKPYLAMIDIAIVNLKDPHRAAAFHAQGCAALKKPDAVEILTRRYEDIRSRLPPAGGAHQRRTIAFWRNGIRRR